MVSIIVGTSSVGKNTSLEVTEIASVLRYRRF
jgi:hypothetical protein